MEMSPIPFKLQKSRAGRNAGAAQSESIQIRGQLHGLGVHDFLHQSGEVLEGHGVVGGVERDDQPPLPCPHGAKAL
mgnify:CR=1 FL=1